MERGRELALVARLEFIFFNLIFFQIPSPRAGEGGFWVFPGNIPWNPACWGGFPTVAERRRGGGRGRPE